MGVSPSQMEKARAGQGEVIYPKSRSEIELKPSHPNAAMQSSSWAQRVGCPLSAGSVNSMEASGGSLHVTSHDLTTLAFCPLPITH